MTINDILSHRKSIRDFYTNIPSQSLAEAEKESLKLFELADYNRRTLLPNGNHVSYAVALCVACICSIDLKYRRKNLLTEDEKQYIAERMCERYKYWSVCDLKCFENMLICGRLPSTRGGQVEYELTSVSIPNLLSKAEVYDRMRPSSGKGADPSVPDSMEALLQKDLHGWKRSPFHIYDDYHRTHDCNGNLVVDPRTFGGTPPRNPGWDYESHWDAWYRTHLMDKSLAPEGFDAEKYWKEPVSAEEQNAIIEGCQAVLRRA